MKSNRKKYPGKFKFQIATEAVRGKRSISEIARAYEINPNLVSRWKQELLEKGHLLFEKPTAKNNPQKRIAELERIIGKLTVELELAKNFLRHYSCR